MPIQTDLSVAPYFDDYDDAKNYDKILFKPGVALQTREINQLQTILQRQIEKFGDNIYVKGTIIDGCNFTYNPNYTYVKIKDLDQDGLGVTVNNYIGLFVKNSSNLVSRVIDAVAGYESQAPDLNTLYVRYLNSGTSGTASSYGADEILTLYDSNNSVFSVKVNGTGANFSNTDDIHFMSAIVVNVTSGGLPPVPQSITCGVTGINATVYEVNTTAIAGSTIYKIKAITEQLSNTQIALANLQYFTGDIVTGANSTSATVVEVLGYGASAKPVTDNSGRVKQVLMTTQGYGYAVPPSASVKTSAVAPSFGTLILDARNFASQVTAGASLSNPVGTGYSFGVSEGIIYQKGYFLQVAPQTVIVDKYNSVSSTPPAPDGIFVGFNTDEAIITSTIDSSLLDNATGSPNYAAPGADRLQLTPKLITLSEADAVGNTNFFPITAFSLGNPYLQNQQTAYSTLGDDLAQRTYDTSGDFVLDPFILSTKTSSDITNESTEFRTTIDPGYAYIKGNRVRTFTNYSLDVPQGIDTTFVPDAQVRLAFGNYVLVKELGGFFNFLVGDYVDLYDTSASFLSSQSNFATGAISPSGTKIGTARFRSITLDFGTPGTPAAQYRLYMYDIHMNAGKNFRSVKSVYYDGTRSSSSPAIADTVLTLDAFTNQNVASIVNTNSSQMLFNVGPTSIKTLGNITYIQRVANGTTSTAANISLGLIGDNTWAYAKSSYLSTADLQSILVIPTEKGQLAANALGSFNVTPNSSLNASYSLITGGTDPLVSTFRAGDYIRIFGADEYTRINTVNSTALQVVGNSVTLTSNSAANIVIAFPNNVPISLADRPGAFANVDSLGQTLYIDLGVTLAANINVTVVANKLVSGSYVDKTSNRNTYVKLDLSNNVANTIGPWALGHPDIYRMNKVYLGSNTTVDAATAVTGLTDVTNEFYIDHNQNPDFYDYGYLHKKPSSNLVLTTSQGLLVSFDHFTNANPGFVVRQSYPTDDTLTFAALRDQASNKVHTLEIPELYTAEGKYYDMIDVVDFRPRVANTANVSAGVVANSTINPPVNSSTTKFAVSGGAIVGFPTPDTVFMANAVFYIGRQDRIVIDKFGIIKDVRGNPIASNPVAPGTPVDSLSINTIYVPPYPSIPQIKSTNLTQLLDKKIASQNYSTTRVSLHSIGVPTQTSTQVEQTQPTRYTVSDLHVLERRIAALEYYVALTLLEQTVKNLVIPSSLNGAINRFKYGFFADNFLNTLYSDLSNPEYQAEIKDEEVVPSDNLVNYEFEPNIANTTTVASLHGKLLTLPYGEFTLVNQAISTDHAVVTPPPPTRYNGVLTPDPRTFSVKAIKKVTAVTAPSLSSNSRLYR